MNTYDQVPPEYMAVVLATGGVFFVIGLVFYVLFSLGLMRIFQKVGENPVAAWIPLWNAWVMFKIAGMRPWFALLPLAGIIPLVGSIASMVGAVFMVIAAYNISLAFKKSGAWAVLYLFLPFVWTLLLGSRNLIWSGVPAQGIMVSDTTYSERVNYPPYSGGPGSYYSDQGYNNPYQS